MFELKSYFHLFGKTALISTAWLFLCGISRSPKKANFGLKDLQTTNMLQTMPSFSEIPLSFYLYASAFVVSVLGGIRWRSVTVCPPTVPENIRIS